MRAGGRSLSKSREAGSISRRHVSTALRRYRICAPSSIETCPTPPSHHQSRMVQAPFLRRTNLGQHGSLPRSWCRHRRGAMTESVAHIELPARARERLAHAIELAREEMSVRVGYEVELVGLEPIQRSGHAYLRVFWRPKPAS